MTHRSFRGSQRRWSYRYHPSGYLSNQYGKQSKVRGTSSEVDNRGLNRRFDSPKSICITGRTQGFLNMKNQSNNNPPKDPVDRKESDLTIDTQPGKEFMQRHQMIKASK